MYYNIKIKSNGSEFSLESNDKEVTQREMDLYFACIFDASADFKSKIKKIEVVNQNVKSIKDFENLNASPQAPMPEPAPQVAPQVTPRQVTPRQVTPQVTPQPITQATPQITFHSASQQTRGYDYTIPTQNMPQEPDLGTIKYQNQKTVESIYDSIIQTPTQEEITTIPQPKNNIKEAPSYVIKNAPQNEVTEAYDVAPEAQNEIDELINLAQKKIDMADTNSKIESILYPNGKQKDLESIAKDLDVMPDIRIESANRFSSHEEEIESYASSNQAKLDDIFNTEKREEILPTPQIEINTENISQISLNDIEVTLEPKINPVSQPKEEQLTPSMSFVEQKDNAARQLDFKPFLSGYACQGIEDEFIVCAYFIKNVLRQPNFTMKFINSKLFQATGKIANMSVVDELIVKEYIRVIETEVSKTYTITQDGELYFAGLQG